MPAYEFWENNTGRTAVTDEQSGQEIPREFEAAVDSLVTTADVIAAAAATIGVAKGQPHPVYTYAYCTRISCDAVPNDPFRYVLKADYKEPRPVPGQPINPAGGGAGGGQPSPPDRQPIYRFTFRRQEVFRSKDVAGNHWVNSAGDLLEDPPPTFECIAIISVTRWYEDGDVAYTDLFDMMNTVNGAVWKGWPKHSLLVAGVDAEPVTENGWVGQKVTWSLEGKYKTPEQPGTATGGWRPTMVLDRGWRVLLPLIGPVAIQDLYGQTRSAPALLDGAGAEKADAADPVYLPFVQYEESDFSIIG